jgi:hypothetical protein
MSVVPQYPESLRADGYQQIEPKGVICKCLRVQQDTNGYYWCCRGALSVPSLSTHTDERGVVRQDHYGPGRQPWDDILDANWGPEFAAGNILKYLRRDKQKEHSLTSANWYHDRLVEMAQGELIPSTVVYKHERLVYRLRSSDICQQLYSILTSAEKSLLHKRNMIDG